MAQLNITLDQDEVLRLLGDNTGDAFRMLLQETLNEVLKAESTEQLNAERYERTPERTDSRNGTRTRPLVTRVGTIELTVPRHRDVPFRSLIFDNYRRSEAALISTMAEMVVGGVSTAKVGRVMETLCGTSFSKQTVSAACKELDDVVTRFATRPLNDEYLFAMADATYLKVREDHRIVSKALMIAMGFTRGGGREVIGFGVYDAETSATWGDFLGSLKARGLSDIRMFTSDSHEGLLSALQSVYPDVPWQRCQAHFARNIAEDVPKKYRQGIRSELVEMFNCATVEEARARRDEIIADYSDIAPKAMACLDAGFDDAMTVMELPEVMRRILRTSNYLERLNREVKRRTNVIGIFPNEGSIGRLVGTLLMEQSQSWQSGRRLYFNAAVEELEKRRERLVRIAMIQRQLAQAA